MEVTRNQVTPTLLPALDWLAWLARLLALVALEDMAGLQQCWLHWAGRHVVMFAQFSAARVSIGLAVCTAGSPVRSPAGHKH